MKILFLLFFSVNLFANNLPSNLELKKMDGEKLELSGDKKLVYFWATWCKSCLPKLQKTLPEMNKNQMPVVTINMDDQIKRAKRYTSKKGIELPVYRDSAGILEKELKITSLPHWAVIEKNESGWTLISHEIGFNREKITKAFNKQ